MKYILVLVEGQTEETFVNRVLNPYLNSVDIWATPIILHTKRSEDGRKYRGGSVKFVDVAKQIHALLQDSSVHAVTTMFDFYALHGDFPGMGELPQGDCYQQIKYLEERFSKVIESNKFIPYFQLHEFEALLFTSPKEIVKGFPEVLNRSFAECRQFALLSDIVDQFCSPEMINNSPQTAPSKRLLSIFPSYDKVIHGSLITGRIGIGEIREQCPHFDGWLQKIILV